MTKAVELETRIKQQIEASRPKPRIDDLRQQAQQNTGIPRLNPQTRVPAMRYPNAVAVRDLLRTIQDLTNINITYDSGLDGFLNRPYALDIQDMSLEEVLNQIFTANQLTFKVINQRTIFVYNDTQQNRMKYEDQYSQTFYISNADIQELVAILNQMVQSGPAIRPIIFQNKSANAIVVRATAPVLEVIGKIIDANDKPRPEVMIEAEILEVDKAFIRSLGIDLSQWALGFTFSPEVGPAQAATTPGAFPTQPPPINLNTLRNGVSASDFYMTAPTALINLLESNTRTKVLARPQMRGRDGVPLSLQLGDLVPIPQTTFSSAAGGGFQNIPTTQVNYQSVGVNLLFTPRVTYKDEIILESLTLENSALGNNLDVGGQTFPTIQRRSAQGSIRLRDGESNMIAGLLRDQDRKALKSLPGLTNLPIIRSLFGNSDTQVEQTDIVMILTPHIVRSHELTPADLKPFYIGSGNNIALSSTPTLISPDATFNTGDAGAAGAPIPGANVPPPNLPTGSPVTGTVPGAPSPAGAANPAAAAGAPATPPRAPGVVPIAPVGGTPATPPASTAVIALAAPTEPMTATGGPAIVPLSITGADQISTLTLTITYDPNLLRVGGVTQGTFMSQGGANPTFSPKLDVAAGRVDMVFSRPPSAGGASGGGLLAAITFQAIAPGVANVTVTGVATSASGAAVPIRGTPATIVVK
jgi:Flp pilus assembly secretin CpaC